MKCTFQKAAKEVGGDMECKGKNDLNCKDCPEKFSGIEGKCHRRYEIRIGKITFIAFATSPEEAIKQMSNVLKEKLNE